MTIHQTEWHIPMTAAERAAGRYMRGPDHTAAGEAAADNQPDDSGKDDAPPADAFDAAFNEATAPEQPPAKEEPAPEQPPAKEEPAADEPENKEQPPAKEEQPPAKTASADEILAGLKELVSKKDEAPAPAPAKEPAAAEEESKPKPIYTDEEQAFLSTYEKDWGDVARGEALKRRAEYRDILSYVFEQVQQFMAPVIETTEALAQGTFVRDLGEKVPDYSDTLREEVIEWTKTQPSYLQAAYNQVIEGGTVDEVKDLVDRYRAATGKTAQPSTPNPTPKKTDDELSGPAKQAAAALAPIKSQRSGVQQPADSSSFDDGWAQFAKADG